MSDIQQQVQQAIDRLVESGAERGVQVAVYLHGEQLVDAVAGVADPATGRPVTPGTVFYNYSIGKAATATVAMCSPSAAPSRLRHAAWPSCGRSSPRTARSAVTVRHVLTHAAGVPGLPADTTAADLCDWDKMCAAHRRRRAVVGAGHQGRLSRLHLRLPRR